MTSNIKNITETFEQEYGKSLHSAMTEIKAKMKEDMYDNDIRTQRVRLFYAANPNFENGTGFYFSVKAKPGATSTFKIN